MIGVAIVIALIAVAVGIAVAILASEVIGFLRRWRRDEPNWWPGFERQFREYAARRTGPFGP
jgi:biopolymer transport protein ExbB/TolQ